MATSRTRGESTVRGEDDWRRDIRWLVLEQQLTLAAIRAAAELGIADKIGTEPRESDDLARELHADPSSLYRLLRALTVPGLLEELPGRRFRLLPLGQALKQGLPGSAGEFVRFILRPYRARACEVLDQAVLSGRVPMEIVQGAPLFEFLERNPSDAALFSAAMTNGSALRARILLSTFDFSGVRTVADIGGGQGLLLASVLAANPHLRGILYDLPRTIQEAPAILKSRGVKDRCDVVGGSFFDRVPPGADTYVLSQILHDWNDAHATRILESVRKAVPPDGRILVIESVMPGDLTPNPVKLLDLSMLIVLGGRERTEAEFADLFKSAGFRLSRILPAEDLWSVIEGIPASSS